LTIGKAVVGLTFGSGLTSEWLSAIVHNTAGKILLTLAALVLAGVAIGFIETIVTGKFKKVFDQEKLFRDDIMWSGKYGGQPASKLLYSLAYIGTPGRVMLFLLLAVLILRITFDPKLNEKPGKLKLYWRSIGDSMETLWQLLLP
jgi:hypothetical protein